MSSRRLTKIQKDEIVEAYRDGENTNTLAEKYDCSANTINRTVKTLLSDVEYKIVKQRRLKINNKKESVVINKDFDSKEGDSDEQKTYKPIQSKFNEEEQFIKTNNQFYNSGFEEIAFLPIEEASHSAFQDSDNSDINKTNLDSDNKLEEIIPLPSSLDFEHNDLSFEILNQDNLPESVYMLVDKKVELEVQPISELPEWSFLPENELKRNAILLFSNQRSAKRSCSRNQRVIKIPNTNVFEVSKSYLLSKGITRLILEDSIIALDN